MVFEFLPVLFLTGWLRQAFCKNKGWFLNLKSIQSTDSKHLNTSQNGKIESHL